MSPTTIKDIAARAGISYATVSRALNGKYGVSKVTREKVKALALEMGYRPNAIARGLVSSSSMTVGLVIPDIANPFFSRVALGVEERLLKFGYSVFLCNTGWNPERERNHINTLIQKQVDGIIMTPVTQYPDAIESMIPKSIPLVYVSGHPKGTTLSHVMIDNVKGADIAVSHLLSRNRKKIAFIGSVQDIRALDDRLSGYRKALERVNIEVSEDLIVLDEFREQSGYKMVNGLLDNGIIPDAVFAENDVLALGVCEGIRANGYRVPEDIAVIGFDDIPIMSHPDIQITTIHQPKYRIGVYAAEILIHQLTLDSAERRMERVTLQPELIVRRST